MVASIQIWIPYLWRYMVTQSCFVCYVFFVYLFGCCLCTLFTYFLAPPLGMWDLSSPTRSWTRAPYSGSSESTAGPPGFYFIEKIFLGPYPPKKRHSWGGRLELELRKRKYLENLEREKDREGRTRKGKVSSWKVGSFSYSEHSSPTRLTWEKLARGLSS